MFVIPTQTSSIQQLIKRSRFIGWSGHCQSPEQAEAFITQHSESHATHNCWAWKIGQQYRSTDDGEPSGTAGRPILRAIEAAGFEQTVVLVIRWYGGIKLGAGGLARAYGGCTNECLSNSNTQPLIEYSNVDISLPFESTNLVHQLCEHYSALIESQNWQAERCIINAKVPADRLSELRTQLLEQSQGKVLLQANDLNSLFSAT